MPPHRIPTVGTPQAALPTVGIELLEWRRVLFAMGDRRYPALGVCPPLYVYDQERPPGWPAHGTLLRVAGLPKNAGGWSRLIEITTGRKVVTSTQAANRTWQTRHNGITEALTAVADSTGQHAGATTTSDQPPPYGASGLGAVKCWRPQIEWRPLPGGGWGYVEVGRYSVWQLI